ncbi:MAG: DUF72 domain-containing protein [Gemmatimonadales bacterium]|nr:DUF72 domain-containing protein [Gemmatimonadales bacterium]
MTDTWPAPGELARLATRVPPHVYLGTSTWTYPGWKGMIYHQDYPATGASAEMLAEYARCPLLTTVGIDSFFYRPPSLKTLREYADALPPDFRCVSKVWRELTIHTFGREDKGRAGQTNPTFLDAARFTEEVWGPMQTAFAEHTGPFVFEFQSLPRKATAAFLDHLEGFLDQLPAGGHYAIELRNPELLTAEYFAMLTRRGAGHVFNSWTRMPSIGMQLDLPGALAQPFAVARMLLRPGRQYAEAVDAFAPYDRIREPNPELRRDVVRIIDGATKVQIPAYLLFNNRAEGNALITLAEVVRRLPPR